MHGNTPIPDTRSMHGARVGMLWTRLVVYISVIDADMRIISTPVGVSTCAIHIRKQSQAQDEVWGPLIDFYGWCDRGSCSYSNTMVGSFDIGNTD